MSAGESDGRSPEAEQSSVHRRIFLSYGHDEHASLAQRMKSDLESRGHEVWFDLDRLKPGGDWEAYIEEGIEWVGAGDTEGRVVLLMTPHSVRRPDGYCLNEIARAISRSLSVIPVMAVWCEPPLSICRIQWLDMQDCVPVEQRGERYECRFERLVEALEQERLDFEGTQARLINLLEPLPFDADIDRHLERFTGREWVLEAIEEWLKEPNDSRIFWLQGAPGVGKSTIAAWLCRNRREVAAFHLCEHGHDQKADPRAAVTSIAYQLSTQLSDYQQRLAALDLGKLVPESDAQTLFDRLIVQPLSSGFPAPDRPIIVLIDGLDEASEGGRNELARFLSTQWCRTPYWLRLIVTSRPEPEVTHRLQGRDAYMLDASEPRNAADIRTFLRRELVDLSDSHQMLEEAIEAIVDRSEGVFLYAEWVRQELVAGRLSLDRPDEFPQGLGEVYAEFFARQFPDEREFAERVRPALEIIAAAREPLTLTQIGAMLDWDEYAEADFVAGVGSLFPSEEGAVRPFHRSVMDWLTSRQTAGPKLLVSESAGHQRIADTGWAQYQAGVDEMSDYMLAHLPYHLRETSDDRSNQLLTDLEYGRRKMADVGPGALVDDIVSASSDNADERGMWRALVEGLQYRHGDTCAQELRARLHLYFGPYPRWPDSLREALTRSQSISARLMLAETHDLEGRHAHAKLILEELREEIPEHDAEVYTRASMLLVHAYEHIGSPEALVGGLEIVESLLAKDDPKGHFGENYWWLLHCMGILLRKAGRLEEARHALQMVVDGTDSIGQAVSSCHHIGVIDIESGELEAARRKFEYCLSERADRPGNYRVAYEYRRLGQLYALEGKMDEASDAFLEAERISRRAGNLRYVEVSLEDLGHYVLAPEIGDCSEVTLSEVREQFGLQRHHIAAVFRGVARDANHFLDELDPETGAPTGRAIEFGRAHAEEHWHGVVLVVAVGPDGRIALQKRSERHSRGRWDVSVSGHRSVGEEPLPAATREAQEELGVAITEDRLETVLGGHSFRKIGRPDTQEDGFRTDGVYAYRTEDGRLNYELCWVFRLQLSEIEAEQAMGPELGNAQEVVFHRPDDVRDALHDEPEQYASSIKQVLLSPQVGDVMGW